MLLGSTLHCADCTIPQLVPLEPELHCTIAPYGATSSISLFTIPPLLIPAVPSGMHHRNTKLPKLRYSLVRHFIHPKVSSHGQ